MYVCICNAVTQNDIRQAVENGADYRDVRDQLGVGTDCGCCGQCAKKIVRECQEEMQIQMMAIAS